jgi:hypothetical protein
MDPYRILGVTKDCTREEVKEAFRARAPIAHPDHGGKDFTFIQLRAAYEQILAELDRRPKRRPDIDRSPRASPEDGNERARDQTENVRGAPREEMPFFERTPQSPDPTAMREAYLAWLHRVSARSSRGRVSALRNFARRRVAKLGSRVLISRPTWQFYCILIFAVLGLIYVTVTVLDLQAKARTLGWRDGSLTGVCWSAIVLCSLLLACWIALKADPT